MGQRVRFPLGCAFRIVGAVALAAGVPNLIVPEQARAASASSSRPAAVEHSIASAEPQGAAPGPAAALIRQVELTATDGQSNDWFGYSVAIDADGRRAIVGAYGRDNIRGVAYLFNKKSGSTWRQAAEIEASDGIGGDYFGYSVAIDADGTRVIVGAYGRSGMAGVAYVFDKEGPVWSQAAELKASNGRAGDFFGYCVAIDADGGHVIIGAQGKGGNRNLGAAYVFDWNGSVWTQAAELRASDREIGDSFGYSVAIDADGKTVAIGSQAHDNFTGAVYVFDEQGSEWVQDAELTASDGVAFDYLGYSVAIDADGTRIIGGAFGRESFTGAAYVFDRSSSSWVQAAELTASDGGTYEYFGVSVSIDTDGGEGVVGAYGRDSNTGAAYVFEQEGSSWTQAAELTASDGATNDYFGYSVAIDANGRRAIVGAYVRNAGTGAAYVFSALPGSE